MGDLLKGIHLLPQGDFETAVENNQIDDDVIYVTPEDFSSLSREQTKQIAKNTEEIAVNKIGIANNAAAIESLKNVSVGQESELTSVKNSISEIILRDINQDSRLDDIEAGKTFVTLSTQQTITGPKTFTEHIYLANSDGTVDRISHLNNNFIIHSGATNSSVLNIDEGLSKIYAFNKELAFKSDIAEAVGTTVYVDGTAVASLNFSADPQTQINLIAEGLEAQLNAISTKANTSDIPTELSQLVDDSTHRLVTDDEKSNWNSKLSSYTETDPTVPAWAKMATKPEYDYSEIKNTPQGAVLYSAIGQNTDGAMTQKATTDALNLKANQTSVDELWESAYNTANILDGRILDQAERITDVDTKLKNNIMTPSNTGIVTISVSKGNNYYQAPKNGYLTIRYKGTSSGSTRGAIVNYGTDSTHTSVKLFQTCWTTSWNVMSGAVMPCKQGDYLEMYYSDGSSFECKFVPSESIS